MLGSALVVLVAPVTRRRHQVSSRHIFRAVVFGFTPLLLTTLADYAAGIAISVARLTIGKDPWTQSSSIDAVVSAILFTLAVVAVAWQVIWWQVTVRDGWGIGGHRAVNAAILVTATLSALVALALHGSITRHIPSFLM